MKNISNRLNPLVGILGFHCCIYIASLHDILLYTSTVHQLNKQTNTKTKKAAILKTFTFLKLILTNSSQLFLYLAFYLVFNAGLFGGLLAMKLSRSRNFLHQLPIESRINIFFSLFLHIFGSKSKK